MILFIVFCFFIQLFRFDCDVSNPTCFVDDPSNYILSSTNVNTNAYLSNEYCAQICYNQGHLIFGTEYGFQCFCGDNIADGAKIVPLSECNKTCPGFPNQTCGATLRLQARLVNCSGDPVPPPPNVPRLNKPCLDMPYKNMPFCNTALTFEDRVKDILGRLNMTEKYKCLSTYGSTLESIGTIPYNWWNEAAHGVASFETSKDVSYTTNFAFPITTAMSFNRTLWWYTASHIAHEARALMNQRLSWSNFWAPVINLAREPRWGRNLETPGEDPYLTGEFSAYFVRGFQESKADPNHVLASACCKHYVANSMDNSSHSGINHWRNEFNAIVPIQDLMDSYMPPFQSCVEIGQVTGLMCSYNAINGIPACANDWLLTKIARGEWKFNGYITADCDADADVFHSHNYTKTPEEAVRVVLKAGTDIDCGGFVTEHAPSALKKGLITEDDIDTRLSYLFKMRMRLGHFDPPGPLDEIPISTICSDYGKELAREGTTQSVTLLKNNLRTLPLPKPTNGKKLKIAVIGPNAKLSKTMAGYYGPPLVCEHKYNTMVDAIKQYADVLYFPGTPSVLSNNLTLIPEAVKWASVADFVVLVVGTDLTWAREGYDARTIVFNEGQSVLIRKVAAAAEKPVIVVMLTANPLDITELLNNPKVGAILHAGQPAVQTMGIGDLIFGYRVPSGRMVQTILPESYQNQISIFDFNMRPGPSIWPRPDCKNNSKICPLGTNPGRTYKFYTGKPVIPFGYGLSYTIFSYQLEKQANDGKPVSTKKIKKFLEENNNKTFPSLIPFGDSYTTPYGIKVTNDGRYDADEVVLGFIIPPGAGKNGIPLKFLFDFGRVNVPKGDSRTIYLFPHMKDFTQVNEKGKIEVLTGEYKFEFGIPNVKNQGFISHTLIVTN